MIRFASLMLLSALAGCTFYGNAVQLEGWPALRVVEHRVSMREVRDACMPYSPALYSPSACAVYYAYECHVWAEAGESGDGFAAIERDHCKGKIKPYWREQAVEIRDRINVMRAETGR